MGDEYLEAHPRLAAYLRAIRRWDELWEHGDWDAEAQRQDEAVYDLYLSLSDEEKAWLRGG
jgi:hypothetical protein